MADVLVTERFVPKHRRVPFKCTGLIFSLFLSHGSWYIYTLQHSFFFFFFFWKPSYSICKTNTLKFLCTFLKQPRWVCFLPPHPEPHIEMYKYWLNEEISLRKQKTLGELSGHFKRELPMPRTNFKCL